MDITGLLAGLVSGGGMLANIGGSTVGGALLLFIVSLFKK